MPSMYETAFPQAALDDELARQQLAEIRYRGKLLGSAREAQGRLLRGGYGGQPLQPIDMVDEARSFEQKLFGPPSQTQQNRFMGVVRDAFPDRTLEDIARKYMPERPKPFPVKKEERLFVEDSNSPNGFRLLIDAAADAPAPFRPTMVRRPGTNSVQYAKTQQDLDGLLAQGFIPDSGAVPGEKPAERGPQFNPTEIEKNLRGEFDDKTKSFVVTRDAVSKIDKAFSNPSPAGDMSGIFSYMKVLDPGSTVREGEYANAQNAGSVPNSIWAQYNKAVAGELLTPTQREDFRNQAFNLYDSALAQYNNEYNRYTDLSNNYKVNPSNVVYDRTGGFQRPKKPAAPPQPPTDWKPLGGGRFRTPEGKIMRWKAD